MSNIVQKCMVADLIGCFLWPVSNYIDKITKVDHFSYLIIVGDGIPMGITNDPNKKEASM